MPAQFRASLLTEIGRKEGASFVIEGHERAVKRGVPQSREKQAVMHVEPLGIVFAFAPGNDM